MDRRQRPARERATLLKAMGLVTACGVDFAACILLGIGAGLFVDNHLHSTPWALLLGLFLGLIAGFYTVYRIIAPIVRAML